MAAVSAKAMAAMKISAYEKRNKQHQALSGVIKRSSGMSAGISGEA